jgi:drug/metabolite transporter (DMT)-like permease
VRAVLLAGIGAVSTAAVLVRLCEAPALVVAVWRLGIAAALLLPVELWRSRAVPARSDLGWCALSGLFLAAHFGTWIASLSYTSVASSVVLVSTNPIFVGLGSRWLLGERLGRRTLWGIGLGVVGTAVVGWGDFGSGPSPLKGDGLALLGALAASAYLLTGRVVRPRLSARTYSAWVYALGALFLLAAAAFGRLPLFPYPASTYGALVLLALVPQLLGHTAINWALAHLPATTVAVVILGEPLGATALAYAVLGEPASASTLAGGACILAGIWLALGVGPNRAQSASAAARRRSSSVFRA